MIRLANIIGRSIVLSEKGGTGNTGAARRSSTGRFAVARWQELKVSNPLDRYRNALSHTDAHGCKSSSSTAQS
jgi:hypothetical protein